MKEYHKIKTIWLRDPETKFKTLLKDKWACPEFEYLANQQWLFTEKVDGTNIRVHWNGEKVGIGGRTDRAQIPTQLLDVITEMFPSEKVGDVFKATDATLYGEGYGAKIQKGGGLYIEDGVSFILFDVCINGGWLQRQDVEAIAAELGCGVVPLIGAGTLQDAIDLASGGFESMLGHPSPEGLVMRPAIELCDRRGQRIIAKVKCKDFCKEQER